MVISRPFRWIRHALYASTLLMFSCLNLVASNWFMLLYSPLALFVFRLLVIPMQDKEHIQAFGETYRDYQNRSGAPFPKLF